MRLPWGGGRGKRRNDSYERNTSRRSSLLSSIHAAPSEVHFDSGFGYAALVNSAFSVVHKIIAPSAKRDARREGGDVKRKEDPSPGSLSGAPATSLHLQSSALCSAVVRNSSPPLISTTADLAEKNATRPADFKLFNSFQALLSERQVAPVANSRWLHIAVYDLPENNTPGAPFYARTRHDPRKHREPRPPRRGRCLDPNTRRGPRSHRAVQVRLPARPGTGGQGRRRAR